MLGSNITILYVYRNVFIRANMINPELNLGVVSLCGEDCLKHNDLLDKSGR